MNAAFILSAPSVRPFHTRPQLCPISARKPARTTGIVAASATPQTVETSSLTQQSPKSAPSCFGRGEQFPRRTVGLYELEREGVNPSKLLDDSKMDGNIYFVLAGLVVAMLLIVPPLFFHISIEWPLAGAIAVLLSAWAVDVLALNSAVSRALSISLQDAERIAHHEAGHFLVGYLLGFRIDDYCIPTSAAILNGAGDELGVRYGNSPASGDAHSVAAVGMAGIAAEVIKYGVSEGGTEDMADVSRSIRACNASRDLHPERRKMVLRWGLIEAVLLLKQHSAALDALREAMLERLSTEQCIQVIERHVSRDQLAEKKSIYAAKL